MLRQWLRDPHHQVLQEGYWNVIQTLQTMRLYNSNKREAKDWWALSLSWNSKDQWADQKDGLETGVASNAPQVAGYSSGEEEQQEALWKGCMKWQLYWVWSRCQNWTSLHMCWKITVLRSCGTPRYRKTKRWWTSQTRGLEWYMQSQMIST